MSRAMRNFGRVRRGLTPSSLAQSLTLGFEEG